MFFYTNQHQPITRSIDITPLQLPVRLGLCTLHGLSFFNVMHLSGYHHHPKQPPSQTCTSRLMPVKGGLEDWWLKQPTEGWKNSSQPKVCWKSIFLHKSGCIVIEKRCIPAIVPTSTHDFVVLFCFTHTFKGKEIQQNNEQWTMKNPCQVDPNRWAPRYGFAMTDQVQGLYLTTFWMEENGRQIFRMKTFSLYFDNFPRPSGFRFEHIPRFQFATDEKGANHLLLLPLFWKRPNHQLIHTSTKWTYS